MNSKHVPNLRASSALPQHKLGRPIVVTLMALAVALAGCASGPQGKSKPKRSKEYFAESKYGVKASPRVTNVKGRPLPRGGGRNQVGKPYKVKGRWYYPKEVKKYAAVGRASWYGDAFHGRLTANGEIYDATHLTAAHPTLPLPSYARVTNLETGASVIVRVNDRGPYEQDRIIDLSQKAAEMLDYQHHGIANVKVEYVGRAPLDGQDDAFLLASYRPGKNAPIGEPATGVMMAMNGPTPTALASEAAAAAAAAMPGPVVAPVPPAIPAERPAAMPVPENLPFAVNPAYGDGTAPIPAARLTRSNTGGQRIAGMAGYAPDQTMLSSYAEQRTYDHILTESIAGTDWRTASGNAQGEYVELGLFERLADAKRIEKALSGQARITRNRVSTREGLRYELKAQALSGANDDLLRAAWQLGVQDAFVVRTQ